MGLPFLSYQERQKRYQVFGLYQGRELSLGYTEDETGKPLLDMMKALKIAPVRIYDQVKKSSTFPKLPKAWAEDFLK